MLALFLLVLMLGLGHAAVLVAKLVALHESATEPWSNRAILAVWKWRYFWVQCKGASDEYR